MAAIRLARRAIAHTEDVIVVGPGSLLGAEPAQDREGRDAGALDEVYEIVIDTVRAEHSGLQAPDRPTGTVVVGEDQQGRAVDTICSDSCTSTDQLDERLATLHSSVTLRVVDGLAGRRLGGVGVRGRHL
jgi:hypothetical protein